MSMVFSEILMKKSVDIDPVFCLNLFPKFKVVSYFEKHFLPERPFLSIMSLPQSKDNRSFFQPSAFLLIGIPGLEAVHGWLSIPFCSMYTLALTGNFLILLAVRRTPSLHQPMYYFLSMLALTDLGLTLCTLPTTLAVLWFDYRHIAFDACLVQMFFLHSFSVVESSVLLAMSFDRFVAISNPLRYASVLTNSVIGRIGLAIVTRATVSLFPVPFLLKRLNFCPEKIQLSHSFCFHADMMKRACADITVNVLYGLYVVLSTGFVDSLLIVLSYGLILHTVIGLASPRERTRALNTCVSHILAVLVFYIPVIGVSIIHRFGRHAPPIVHSLVAYIYLIVPPVLNPIIYSVKSKHIREAMFKLLRRKGQS
ncbi:olfactory receptor 51I2-like isoform X2 [Macrotis lagotis]|uniref:olfactory receptor 51I2-like isoform X2 n=1 Tax=Macrotis lagotis TaxID=92651 RepID=UPI003D68D20E